MSLRKKMQFIFNHPDFPLKLLKLKNHLKTARASGKQLWVFQCDFEGHFPYLKPYFEYSKSINDVEIFFSIGNPNPSKVSDYLIDQGVANEHILFPVDLVSRTIWDVYLSPTEWGNIFPGNKDAFRVQVFHTLADKNLEYSKELLNFNIVFANGPVHHDFLDKYIFTPYPESKNILSVYNTGFAKIDDLFTGYYSKDKLKEELHIDRADKRKIILYAPNWEAGSALRMYGEDVFRQLTSLPYTVLIKLHYMSLLSPDNHYATGGVNWKAILEKYEKYENIRIAYNQNINPYLFLADLMLTDYGGASLEYMSTGKPIVYLDCPEFFNERGQDIFENKARETGYIINDVKEIPDTIKNSLDKEDVFINKRKQLSNQLLYNPGKAAAAGFTTLYKLVQNKNRI